MLCASQRRGLFHQSSPGAHSAGTPTTRGALHAASLFLNNHADYNMTTERELRLWRWFGLLLGLAVLSLGVRLIVYMQSNENWKRQMEARVVPLEVWVIELSGGEAKRAPQSLPK